MTARYQNGIKAHDCVHASACGMRRNKEGHVSGCWVCNEQWTSHISHWKIDMLLCLVWAYTIICGNVSDNCVLSPVSNLFYAISKKNSGCNQVTSIAVKWRCIQIVTEFQHLKKIRFQMENTEWWMFPRKKSLCLLMNELFLCQI